MGRAGLSRLRRLSGWLADQLVVTRQTWTAATAALIVVGLAIALAVTPAPYVTWSPGGVKDTLGTVGKQPIISISGLPTYPTTGRLDLTTVNVSSAGSRVSLPEALFAYWAPHRETLPRGAVYAPDKSADQVEHEEVQLMETAQSDAAVAALRAAGEPVTEQPVVASVTVGGPADGKLQPGDLIERVDGAPVAAIADVGTRIRRHAVGETVVIDVLRAGAETSVRIVTGPSSTDPAVPVVGIAVGVGYRYEPTISFDLGQRLGGPSAGMVFALAIYDKITIGPLLDGRHLAGTGTITPTGAVGPIGGIREKIAAAQSGGASVFLFPVANCPEVAGVRTSLRLVSVGTLAQAIDAVQALGSPREASLPNCP